MTKYIIPVICLCLTGCTSYTSVSKYDAINTELNGGEAPKNFLGFKVYPNYAMKVLSTPPTLASSPYNPDIDPAHIYKINVPELKVSDDKCKSTTYIIRVVVR
jgi:hypothetical protein